MIIRNFCAQDFGKMYRSCGNCSSQYARHVEMDNVMIMPRAGPLAGINTNYNDTAKFTRITVRGSTNSIRICERYTGNSTGAEPSASARRRRHQLHLQRQRHHLDALAALARR